MQTFNSNRNTTNFCLVIVLLFTNILDHASSLSTKHSTYNIFDIPPFKVNLTFDSSRSSISSPSTQLDISTKIKSATSSYLFDYFDSIISQYDHDQQSWATFEGIELQVSLYTGDDGLGIEISDTAVKQTLLIAEMHGSVSFSKKKLEHGFTLNKEKVTEMTQRAFMGQYAMDDYSSKVQNILPSVMYVNVQTNYNVIGNEKGGMGFGIVMLILVTISTFILLSYFCYREYQVKKCGGRTRNGHLLMDMDNHSDCYDEDEIGNFTGFTSEQTFDSEPVQFIPVPARVNEVTNGNGRRSNTSTKLNERRYVTPASPFELLYGAAFSHRDRDKVHRAKKKSRNRFFHAPRAKQMKPLNTITEANDEDESFFPQFMSSITAFISDKMDGQKNKEDFVVFRDFPRHDGTPCVMFTPVHEVDWEARKQQQNEKEPRASILSSQTANHSCENDDSDLSYDHSSSSFSNLQDGNKEVDSFVDKLESLMADRSRQYEERKKFEAELEEEKKKHAAEKLRNKEATLNRSVPKDEESNEVEKSSTPTSSPNGSPVESQEFIDLCTGEVARFMEDANENECDLLKLNNDSEQTNNGSKETTTVPSSNNGASSVNDYLLEVSNSLPSMEEEKNPPPIEQQLNMKKVERALMTEVDDDTINEINVKIIEDSENNLESPRDVETAHFDSSAGGSTAEKTLSQVFDPPSTTECENSQESL